mgnify:CR=1 FL=1
MNTNSVVGEILETGVSAVKQTGKTVAGAVSDTGKAAASQVTGRSKDTQDIVKSLYAESEKEKDKSQRVEVQDSNDQSENTPEGLDKKKKLEELRQELHNEVYYDPLVNPPKPQREEERPAEKVEREEMEEIQDLQKKEKEKPPPLVQRTQQRVEKLPGASG